MNNDKWAAVLGRIGVEQPVDLDTTIFATDTEQKTSGSAGSIISPNLPISPPSSEIWPLKDDAQFHLGIRLNSRDVDTILIASKLAAAAFERGITPIILTNLPFCGLECYGFRIERTYGKTAAEQKSSERELMQFWRIELLLDAAEFIAAG